MTSGVTILQGFMLPEWIDDDKRLHDMVLSELDVHARRLFEEVQACPDGLRLLRFISLNSHTLLSIEDIAFNLGLGFAQIEKSLQKLSEMGLVRRVQVVGVVLFGSTDDPDTRETVKELVEWQERWQDRLDRLQSIVEGVPPQKGRRTSHG